MGNKGPIILAGVGAFLLVTALLLRFYAYPALAVAPADQDSTTVLTAAGATVLDTGTGQEETVDVVRTVETRGDVAASQDASDEAGYEVVVWDSAASSKTADGELLSRSLDRVAFDAHDAVAVECCDTYVESEAKVKEQITPQGLLVKFPFATEKKSYDWWDSDLRQALPIDFVDSEDVEGLATYKFKQIIEPTKYGERPVPASYLGLDEEGNVDAELYYGTTRTLWVEPVTGVIINRTEEQLKTLRYQGEDRTITTKATIGFDDATVKANADEYGPKSTQLNLARNVVPPIFGLLGLVLLVGAGLISRRR